jgi:hypothetical protein
MRFAMRLVSRSPNQTGGVMRGHALGEQMLRPVYLGLPCHNRHQTCAELLLMIDRQTMVEVDN